MNEYHRTVSLADFMTEVAPALWPPSARFMYCFQYNQEAADCRTKQVHSSVPNDQLTAWQGNPFKSFWDNINVDFVEDRAIRWSYKSSAVHWQEKLLVSDHPVLALRGIKDISLMM